MIVVDNGRAYLTDQRFYESTRRMGSRSFLIPLDNSSSNS